MNLRAVLCIGALLVAYFWQPLRSPGLLAPVDILQDWRVLSPRPVAVHNPNQSDVALLILPFLEWNVAELRAGRIPTWNPYRAWGAPHLGAAQSAVFSPFSLPYYLFEWRAALLLAHFLKLFIAGWFTWLFLRLLACSFWPALAGATLYTFSGFELMWLLWNNSAVAATLPACLYFLESWVQRRDRRMLAGLALSLAAGMLAGHPETFFFVVLGVLAWAAFRGSRRTWPGIALACFAGLLVSGVQTLPFLEYLRLSSESVKGVRHATLPGLHPTSLVLQLCPDLLGNPTTSYHHGAATNHSELNSGYVGAAAVFLVSLAILGWRRHRSREVTFLLAMLALWAIYAYDPFGLYRSVFVHLPLLGMAAPKRSAPVGLFAIACVSALTLERVADLRPLARWWSIVFQSALLLMFLRFLPAMNLASDPARAEIGWRIALVTAALGALTAWCSWRDAPRLAGAVLPLAFFAQTALQLLPYNRAIERAPFPPGNELSREIAGRAAGEQTGWAPSVALYSSANSLHRIRILSNVDALQVRAYDESVEPIHADWSERSLQLLGVRYFMDGPEPYGAEFGPRATGGATLQTFRADNDIVAISARIESGPGCVISFREASGRELATARCEDATPWFRVPRVRGAAGRDHAVEVRGGRLLEPVRPARGFASALRPLWTRDGVTMREVRDPMPRFYSVGRAEHAANPPARMLDPAFDYLRAIVLSDPPPPGASSDEVVTARMVEDLPTRIRVDLDRRTPGWFFTFIPWYPGWRASINGQPTRTWRANGGFTAVQVTAGRSDIVLEYDPLSVRVGLWMSAAGLALCAWLAWAKMGVRS